LQVLNVVLGGTLHQHLPDLPGTLVHSPEWRGRTRGRRERWGPPLPQVEGSPPRPAPLGAPPGAAHTPPPHPPPPAARAPRAAGRIGSGLGVAARSVDGVVEALVGTDSPVLGVQWHPEMHRPGELAGEAPFRWLVSRLVSRRAA